MSSFTHDEIVITAVCTELYRANILVHFSSKARQARQVNEKTNLDFIIHSVPPTSEEQ